MNKQEFKDDGIASFRLSQSNDSQRANFGIEPEKKLTLSKNIGIHQALDLTDIQRTNLESIQKLLDGKAIGFNDLLELPLLTDKRIDLGNGKVRRITFN